MRSGVRHVRALPLAIMLVAGSASNALAQAPDRNNSLRPAASVLLPPSGLAREYRVSLTSQWNRPGIVAPCPIEGGETVEGVLAWTGAMYEGVLRRTTNYRECGVHSETCRVTVDGRADVQAAGELLQEGRAWALSLRWTPARDVHVAVGGNCPPDYREGLERLYRTTTQRVEFALPGPNAVMEVALEPAPWLVRVE